ncbi:glycoside hydrolase family 3 C-terminal domain-containing protein, partial [Streptomyces rubiginosohelvolus]|uniref:glycoside hydrolase family 3 protein n=1 Tax=Streptomyces rubiginosohelvolus TaxID=67362 RepID=UPI003406AC87
MSTTPTTPTPASSPPGRTTCASCRRTGRPSSVWSTARSSRSGHGSTSRTTARLPRRTVPARASSPCSGTCTVTSADRYSRAARRPAVCSTVPRRTTSSSCHASAATDGHDVGVVVVGETPYAEGIGDVGNGHDLELTAADKAAVDKVCAAMKCAVLIVSGRPQLIGDQLGDMDALVASWLPGSEGDGVADVLYGKRPFTGQLPVTWP